MADNQNNEKEDIPLDMINLKRVKQALKGQKKDWERKRHKKGHKKASKRTTPGEVPYDHPHTDFPYETDRNYKRRQRKHTTNYRKAS